MLKRPTPLLAGYVAVLLAAALSGDAAAQPPFNDHNLPVPRLNTVFPCGGKAGTAVEVTVSGTDLEDPQELRFSLPTIKGEPIVPPPPPPMPPPDPKKPAPAPPPKPAVPITRFKVTIPADAPPGLHDVRLVNRWGISNPRAFVVGDLNEVAEKEPNNDVAEAQRVPLNTTVNGVIAASTDVDYFVFAAKKDQRVLVSCLASSIDSKLHAGLELYDAAGRQLARNRKYSHFDALLDYTVPADGDYYVRLTEFAHTQGNGEHYYRLSFTTAPWIDAVFPPVVVPGKPARVTVYGRNLPGGQHDPLAIVDGCVLEKLVVELPATSATGDGLAYRGFVPPYAAALDGFEYRLKNASGTSNPYLITFAHAPVVLDNEANDTPETAQLINVPCEIAGRVEKKHDRDWYRFAAKKGEVYNIDLFSERLGSPTDMRYLLRNEAAKQDITEQDDNPDVFSLKFFARTHDPAPFRCTVPADGTYLLQAASQTADVSAGPRHLYRVRITPDAPDFQVVVMPSDHHRPDSCTLLQGGCMGFTAMVIRQDGWTGEVALAALGLPKGVTCPPQVLGSGVRQTELILAAAPDAPAWTGAIKVTGTAVIKGITVTHEARAATITWPVQPQQNIPTISRVDRGLFLAVRDIKAPYALAATLDQPYVQQGDKATIALKLNRLMPDFKSPLLVAAIDLPPNVTVNNGQQLTIAADKAEGTLALDVKPNAQPGTYNLVLRSQGQVPFAKDPKAAQKPAVNVVLPANALSFTVLPKTVATVAASVPAPNVKPGGQTEVVVKVARQFEYVAPPTVPGFSADPVTIPAGADEVKLILKVGANAPLGQRPDLVIRAVATLANNVAATQEAKLAVNVLK
jgi:hypothetical protein